jgi:hypothetical protein
LIYAGLHPSVFRSSLAIALMAGLLGFLLWAVIKRQWVTLFFAAWFVIVLSPLLPLRDHITDCYLTIPTLGLAMWGAQALVAGWRNGIASRAAAVLAMVIYLGVNIPVAHINAQSFHDNSQRIRTMLDSIVDRTSGEPGKIILLEGVSRDLFWDSIWSRPFRLFNRNEVYMILEDGADVLAVLPPELRTQFFLTRAEALTAMDEKRAALFDVAQPAVRPVTAAEYRQEHGL